MEECWSEGITLSSYSTEQCSKINITTTFVASPLGPHSTFQLGRIGCSRKPKVSEHPRITLLHQFIMRAQFSWEALMSQVSFCRFGESWGFWKTWSFMIGLQFVFVTSVERFWAMILCPFHSVDLQPEIIELMFLVVSKNIVGMAMQVLLCCGHDHGLRS